MKIVTIFCAILGGLFTGLSAQPSPGTNPIKSERFSIWAGRWQGTSTLQMGPGEPKTAIVDEQIQYKLDSTLLLIEGIGRHVDPDGKSTTVVHHAMAVLSFDPYKGTFSMRSYLADGRSTDAWFKTQPDGAFQWGFEAPNVNMRYTIRLDAEKMTWNEIGEFSRDGNDWFKVFEMNLKKVE
jgi:hypothetical protein